MLSIGCIEFGFVTDVSNRYVFGPVFHVGDVTICSVPCHLLRFVVHCSLLILQTIWV